MHLRRDRSSEACGWSRSGAAQLTGTCVQHPVSDQHPPALQLSPSVYNTPVSGSTAVIPWNVIPSQCELWYVKSTPQSTNTLHLSDFCDTCEMFKIPWSVSCVQFCKWVKYFALLSPFVLSVFCVKAMFCIGSIHLFHKMKVGQGATSWSWWQKIKF